ncbi:hypothetical protein KAJ27_09870, partial [bacterium]|nr:hypothetical protein [bacterium]
EKIEGLQMKDEIYDVENIESGKLRGFDSVYVLGNAVTGRGNINQSRIHSRKISENIVDQYLSLDSNDYADILDSARERAEGRMDSILNIFKNKTPLTQEHIETLLEKIISLQKKQEYNGQYSRWIEKYTPSRLENMLGNS